MTVRSLPLVSKTSSVLATLVLRAPGSLTSGLMLMMRGVGPMASATKRS
jgi:hypothetical protein